MKKNVIFILLILFSFSNANANVFFEEVFTPHTNSDQYSCSSHHAGYPLNPFLPSSDIIFAYSPVNETFISDLMSKIGHQINATIVVDENHLESFQKSKLLKVINFKNQLVIKGRPAENTIDIWMQDFLHISTNGEYISFFEMGHKEERVLTQQNKIITKLSELFNIPAYRVSTIEEEYKNRSGSLSYGGNFLSMPGGFYVTGVMPFHHNFENNILGNKQVKRTSSSSVPYSLFPNKIPLQNQNMYSTDFYHEQEILGFENFNQHVLKLNIEFSKIGHIDEIFSIVKTKGNTKCDFALVYASPNLALSILRQKVKPNLEPNRCQHSLNSLLFKFVKYSTPIPATIDEFNEENGCIFDTPIEDFTNPPKKYFTTYTNEVNNTIEGNKTLLVNEISKRTGCQNIKTVPLPVLFKPNQNDLFFPNPVNALIITPKNEATTFITPRTFYPPFDKAIKENLSQHGINVITVEDLALHASGEDIHCGTKTIPKCD